MYNWTFVFFTMAIIFCILALACYALDPQREEMPLPGKKNKIARFATILFIMMAVGNLASAFLQNGFGPFRASNQQHYEILYEGDVMKP